MYRNFTKLFYSNISLQLIFIVDVVRVNKPIQGDQNENKLLSSLGLWKPMCIQRYLKLINRLPNPSGSLFANLLSTAIVSANCKVEKVTGSARKIRVYVVASNTASHLLLTMASHLNLSMARGVTSPINAHHTWLVKLFSFNLICMKII